MRKSLLFLKQTLENFPDRSSEDSAHFSSLSDEESIFKENIPLLPTQLDFQNEP